MRWLRGSMGAAAVLLAGLVAIPQSAAAVVTVTPSSTSVGDHLDDGHDSFDPAVTITASSPITKIESTPTTPLGATIDRPLLASTSWRLTFKNPGTVGKKKVTFTVTTNAGTATTSVVYGVSRAGQDSSHFFADPRYLYRSSDLSTAIDVGDNYVLAVASDDNFIGLYANNGLSQAPVRTWNAGSGFGTSTSNLDIEAMARAGSFVYLVGSHSNDDSGNLQPRRKVVERFVISGTGSGVVLRPYSRRTDLGSKLAAWDTANGSRLHFAAAQKSGISSDSIKGFNIEGLEFLHDSTDYAFLAFRAPLIAGKYSLLLRIKLATFMHTGSVGTPVRYYANLGGRTFREIRRNPYDGQYLITAYSASVASSAERWALYTWTGQRTINGTIYSMNGYVTRRAFLPNPDSNQQGPWEAIVPTGMGAATLISDDGNNDFYDDRTRMTDEPLWLRKSFAGDITYLN